MKQIYSMIALFFMTAIAFAQQPIITAIVDGDCSGGNPKLLEIYAQGTVDFSQFTLQNQTNANTGAYTSNFSLAGFGTVTDTFVYVATTGSSTAIASDFPSLSNATILTSGTVNVNGNDRLRIINSSGTVIDQYGVDDVVGDGQTWEYTDSYATRIDGTGPDGGFTLANWSFAGAGALDTKGVCQGGSETFESIIGRIGAYSPQASSNPDLNINGAPVTGLNYFENNGPSNEGTFTVAGMNLNADVVITASTFEISLASGSGFGPSVSVSPTSGDLATTTI